MERAHDHANYSLNRNKSFGFGIALNVAYIIVEAVFGILVNSAALLADAGHNLSDVIGLVMAWGGAYLAGTPTTSRRTYGLRKATVMAALLNALILLVAVGAITVEAIRKIVHPEPIGGTVMMIVAGIGVIINGLTALLFIKGKENDINIRGAFLHMAADAGVSVGVVLAGLLINVTGILLIDPLMSLAIVFVVTAGTWGLLRDSFHLSMDAAPEGVAIDQVRAYLNGLEGVEEVHDLHVWAMSTTEIALTAHLVMPLERYANDGTFLRKVCADLHVQFGIEHATIQIENNAQSPACDDEHV